MGEVNKIFGIREKPPEIGFKELRQSVEQTEDYAVKKVINTVEGTIEKTPVDNNDIVNKAYCDANGGGCEWTVTGSDIYYNTGYVGVGTDAPSQPLEVISQTAGFMAAFRALFAGSSGAVLRVYKALGSLAAPRRVSGAGITLGGINAFGYEAVDNSTNAVAGAVSGQFLFRSTEAFTSTTKGASFRMMLCPIGSATLGAVYEIYHDGTDLHWNLANIPAAAGVAPAGLVAGDLWVDTAAGNVVKRV